MRGAAIRIAGLAALAPGAVSLGLAQSQLGDREFGRHLSAECIACHQLSGRSEGIPPIVGWPEGSFIAIMNEYREKKRANPVMQIISGKFNDEEIAALAAYFGSLPPGAMK